MCVTWIWETFLVPRFLNMNLHAAFAHQTRRSGLTHRSFQGFYVIRRLKVATRFQRTLPWGWSQFTIHDTNGLTRRAVLSIIRYKFYRPWKTTVESTSTIRSDLIKVNSWINWATLRGYDLLLSYCVRHARNFRRLGIRSTHNMAKYVSLRQHWNQRCLTTEVMVWLRRCTKTKGGTLTAS